MKYLLLTLIISCGTDPSEPAPAEDVSRETLNTPTHNTLALESFDELPECAKPRENWLVYVQNEGGFFTCKKGEWLAIDVSGNDGQDGANGRDGKDGLDGQDGASGATGPAGRDGKMFWTDPKTKKVWFVPGQAYGSSGDEYCLPGQQPYAGGLEGTFGWPTKSELSEALANGLFDGLRVRVAYPDSTHVFSDDPETYVTNEATEALHGMIACIYNDETKTDGGYDQ